MDVIEKKCRELAEVKDVKLRRNNQGVISLSYQQKLFNKKLIFTSWEHVLKVLESIER